MSCPRCQEGYILPGEPTGTIEKAFNGAYYSPAPDGKEASHAVILLTDAFGLATKNCKVMADEFAKRLNCDVWIPDYFEGRPLIPASNMRAPDHAAKKMSIWDWILFVMYTIPNIPAFIRSRPSVSDARVVSFLALLKEKKHYNKLGAIGYCYGGATAVRFAGTTHISSAVICHPAPFSIQQLEAIQVPTSWACAEVDIFWSHEKRIKTEAGLAGRKGKETYVEYEFIDYKGTAHGFAARPNLSLPEIKEAHTKAIDQAVNWFQKTISPQQRD